MKKFIFVLILPIMSLTFFSQQNYQYYPSTADSGFDSDYGDYDGGGSWGGGGSSWDDDDDYSYSYDNDGYSGEPADPQTVLIALLIVSVPCIAVVVIRIAIVNHNKKQAKTQHIHRLLAMDYGLRVGDGKNSETIQTAYNNYVEIQKAWMNRDLTPVKHILTDEIFNMYQMQVETLIEDNQVNVMSHFEFVCGDIISVNTKKNIETTKVILCVNCKDYIKDLNKHKVVSGDKGATITYVYELTFIRDLNSNELSNCPSCGALVKNQMSITCPYCNNSLLLTSSNLTLSNKKILHQFKQ